MATKKLSTVFFAYGSQDSLVSDTMQEAAKILLGNGIQAATWEDLPVAGRHLISAICTEIDRSEVVIAEVGSLNGNVLFEAGYALGKGKVLVPVLDETKADAVLNWKALGLLTGLGRLDYTGNASKLAVFYMKQAPRKDEPLVLDRLLSGASPKEANSVFAPAPPVHTTALSSLTKMLERDRDWSPRGSSDDLGVAPLELYVKELYRSSAALISVLGPDRTRAREHNARASFLAGIAHGMALPLLIVGEPSFVSPLDYQDMYFGYRNSSDLQKRVRSWLDANHLKWISDGTRSGRLALDIELPIRSFGQYVAEYERDQLADYFVPTSEYEAMLQGHSKIFVGRKGTGKTATMQRMVDDLRQKKSTLVVPIKPANYELSGLVETLKTIESESSTDYMLLALWSYLIYTEIAAQVVRHFDTHPAGWPTRPEIEELRLELERLNVKLDDDLSARLERAVADLTTVALSRAGSDREGVAKVLRAEQVKRLRTKLSAAIREYDRVAVLFDNLDKAWQRGVDYPTMSRFLLSLLVASGTIERELRRDQSGTDGPTFTLAIFLRTDIYDIVSTYAREPDKIETLEVRWRDEDLLLRVIEERFSALRTGSQTGVQPNVWAEIFAPEVRGLGTRDYLPWRVMARPRDLVYFANAALTSAINNRHNMVLQKDFLSAEQVYSEFAVDALLVEGQSETFDLEAVVYEFVSAPAILPSTEVLAMLAKHGDPDEIRDWLLRSTFLGVEIGAGKFEHVEGASRAKRRLRVAQTSADRDTRPLRFRIHPAFRPFLEIRDDDLYFGSIEDVTLEQ